VRLTIGVAPNPVIDIDLIGIGFTTDTPWMLWIFMFCVVIDCHSASD
jgi:hypothetical protein